MFDLTLQKKVKQIHSYVKCGLLCGANQFSYFQKASLFGSRYHTLNSICKLWFWSFKRFMFAFHFPRNTKPLMSTVLFALSVWSFFSLAALNGIETKIQLLFFHRNKRKCFTKLNRFLLRFVVSIDKQFGSNEFSSKSIFMNTIFGRFCQ